VSVTYWLGFATPCAFAVLVAVVLEIACGVKASREGLGRSWAWDCPDCSTRSYGTSFPWFVPAAIARRISVRNARRQHLAFGHLGERA
jgi:hypothetical protein